MRVHQYGGSEALTLEDMPVPEPKAGEARVKIEAIGVNYIDVFRRSLSPADSLHAGHGGRRGRG